MDKELEQLNELKQRFLAQIRAKVEHPFRVIKRQFGYTKVHYRGLKKNTLQLKTLFAPSNLWMVAPHVDGGMGMSAPETREKAANAASGAAKWGRKCLHLLRINENLSVAVELRGIPLAHSGCSDHP